MLRYTLALLIVSTALILGQRIESHAIPAVEDSIGKNFGSYYLGEEVPVVWYAKNASDTVRATVFDSAGSVMDQFLLTSFPGGYGAVKHGDLHLDAMGTYEINSDYYFYIRNETTNVEDVGFFNIKERDAGFGTSAALLPERFVQGDTVVVAVHGGTAAGTSFIVTDSTNATYDTFTGVDVEASVVCEITGLPPGYYMITAVTHDGEHAPVLVKVERKDEHRSSKADIVYLDRKIEMNFSERRKFDERQRDEKRSPP